MNGSFRSARRGGLKWDPRERTRPETVIKSRPLKRAAAQPENAPQPAPQAPPDLASGPLPLLPVRHFLILTVLILAAGLLVWGLVRSNHLSVGLSYEISELTQRKLSLLETNRQLKTELTKIGALDKLEEAAVAKLGLVTPNQGQIVVIDQ